MKQRYAALRYISLALGILFVMLGLVFFLLFSTSCGQILFSKSSVFSLVLGAVFLFITIAITHRTFHLFLGLNFCFLGITLNMFRFHIFGLTLKQFWPIYMIFCGLFLFQCGFYKYKHFRTTYNFPAYLLIILGCIFGLFSFKIIKTPFSTLFVKYWPFILILLGAFLIGTFLYQQKSETSFPYLPEDDYDDDCDNSGEEV